MRCTARCSRYQSAARSAGKHFRLLLVPVCLGLVALLGATVPLAAQNHRLVYASAAANETISGFTVDPSIGALTPIPGSPFSFKEPFDPHTIVVHPSGKFLYVLSLQYNEVSAFQIDPTTGALTELQNPPFAAGQGGNPLGIAIDPSGKFLYELETAPNNLGGSPTLSYLNSYSIDQTTGALTLATPSFDVAGTVETPLVLLADSADEQLYVVGSTGSFGAVVAPFQINSNSGSLAPGNTFGEMTERATSAAISPNGKFWYVGIGQNEAEVEGSGTLLFTLSAGDFPEAMAVDSTSSYLYIWFAGDGLRGFAIDPGTGALNELSGSPFAPQGPETSLVADATGPILYSSNHGAFQISANGALAPISGFYTAGSITGIGAFSPVNPIQPVSGPSATFLPHSLSFQPQAAGTTSTAQQIALSNSGNQELIISGVSIAGTNSADFTIQSTCPPVLAPGVGCAFAITYQPSSAGSSQASLTISDNVAGGSSTAALVGSGFVPAAAVTLVPGSLSFPDTDKGASSSTKSITVTNSGTAALHVPANGVTLTGANPSDFSQTNTCGNSTVVTGGSCTVTVTFQPATVAQSTAQVQISDDAQDAPQSVSLAGTGVTPFVLTSSSSASQTVPAGMTAQYNLQLMSAGGFAGMVSLSCTGAPQGATCTVPSTASVNGPGIIVTVTTTARSGVRDLRGPLGAPRMRDLVAWREGWDFLAFMFLAFAFRYGRGVLRSSPRISVGYAAVVLLTLISLALVACGGGTTASAPAVPGTPSGTFTLTVTASAGGVVQPFNLTLTVQ